MIKLFRFAFVITTVLTLCVACSSAEIEEPIEIIGGRDSESIYIFYNSDSVVKAHKSTITIVDNIKEFQLYILSYGLESITKIDGSEYITTENQVFPYPVPDEFYYSTSDNPVYKRYRYRQPIIFLFQDNLETKKPTVTTFRIKARGENGHYADITIVKDPSK